MSGDAPSSRNRSKLRVWDLPVRLFHWLLVAAIVLAFLPSEEGSPLNHWHILSGWVAALLVTFRSVWGFVGGEHARFSRFVRPGAVSRHLAGLFKGRAEPELGHNPLGGLSIVVMLFLIAATILTGLSGGVGEEIHELVAYLLLAMIVVHVIAVILMSVLTRENLVRAMVSGRKPAARHPGARDARRPSAFGAAFAAVSVVAATLVIVRFDPLAFEPRSLESAEHGAGGEVMEHDEAEDED